MDIIFVYRARDPSDFELMHAIVLYTDTPFAIVFNFVFKPLENREYFLVFFTLYKTNNLLLSCIHYLLVIGKTVP